MNLLSVLSVVFRGDTRPLENDMDNAVRKAERAGQRMSDALKGQMFAGLSGGSGLGALVGDSLTAAAGIGILAGSFKALKYASDTAADFGFYRRQLTGIAGDADIASKALNKLSDIAGASNFDTNQVMGLGVALSSKYNDVGKGASNSGRLLDAAAASGVENRNFGDFQHEVEMIAGLGFQRVGIETVNALKRSMPTLNSQVAKATGVDAQTAEMRLRSMTGNQLLETLYQIGDKNKGAAATVAGSDPQSVFANVLDDVRIGLEPTGRLINDALLPAANGVKYLSGQFKALNSGSGGMIGLGIGVGVVTTGTVLLVRGLYSAATAVATLTTSVNALAASAGRTAGAAAGSAGVGVAGAAAGAAGVGVAALSSAVAVGVAQAVGNFQAIQIITDIEKPRGADETALLVGLTSFLTMLIPGLGIGITAGSAMNGVNKPGEKKPEAAANKMQQAADTMAGAVNQFKAQLIGGGARANQAGNSVMREYAVWQMMKSQQTGLS
jgi:hypothetical protein